MTYDDAIEKLSIYFTAPKYENEVLAAKGEFFRDVGIDDKESARYEQWMSLFFDWYLFTRPLSGASLPPVKFALEISEFQPMIGDFKETFKNLADCQHSLFQLAKIKGDRVYFKELFSKKKKCVINADFAITLPENAICDFRLIPEGDEYYSTKGFCAHPVEANKFILKQVKELKKADNLEKEQFLLELMRMFFKMEQYSHLKHDQVYCKDSKVRF